MTTHRPDRIVELPGGRRLALDDRGDRAGRPVLYLHGTPDTRLARHPDETLLDDAGARLLAPDRPGLGGSDPDPRATPASVAGDLVGVLDALGVDRCCVLAWSAGAIFALALAGAHPGRVERIVLAAPLVPADAYSDAGVMADADDGRRLFAEMTSDATPDELGDELAPFFAPPSQDRSDARIVLDRAIAATSDIDGAGDALIDSFLATTATGLTGLEREIAAQATPLGVLDDAVRAPASIHSGRSDDVAPATMAAWIATSLDAAITEHDAGHELALTRWSALLHDCSAGPASRSSRSR